jgi:transcriptional regulator with XRE-family HTH domain
MNSKEIGKKIKSIRQTQGLSREQLAEKLNVTKYAIINYEQGQRGASIKILNKIAEALGVTINTLLKDENISLGENIKKLRKDKGLTQDKLSEITKISIASIQRYESGKRQPNIQTVNKFAQALNVSLDDLVGNEYNKSKLELENALQNGADNTPNLISNFKDLTKKEVANNFNELVEILEWNDFKNINEDDIFEVIKSKEFYNYLKFLFLERINKV